MLGVDRIDNKDDYLTSKSTLSAGYVYLSFSNSVNDKTCSKTSVQVGVPANVCVTASGKSYKVQLVEGTYLQNYQVLSKFSPCFFLHLIFLFIFLFLTLCCGVFRTDGCSGATVQLFSDSSCMNLINERSLTDSTFSGCNAYDGENTVDISDDVSVTVPLYYWKLHCTAQPTKPIAMSSAVVE